MSDKRRARKAKQARRDARRAKKRNGEPPADPAFRDAIRGALRKGPFGLLSAAGYLIHRAKAGTPNLDQCLAGLIGERNRETTALLAVIAELLVDDPVAELRCRHELADRNDPLPQWIRSLPKAEVYRAVRRSHVLGDADELVLGMRLGGGHELSVAILIDHLTFSGITDAAVVSDPIGEALARVAETDTDTEDIEMAPADARAWIEAALTRPTLTPETEAWPLYRPVVHWLVGRLSEGGVHRPPTDWAAAEELCDNFFATDSAAPFTDPSHRQLLLELFETGSGDPLRWSAARVDQAIGDAHYDDGIIPLEVTLDAPDLLRAFIPYAHAQSGIRDELTSRTLAAVDARRSRYKREVLRQVEYWGYHDAV